MEQNVGDTAREGSCILGALLAQQESVMRKTIFKKIMKMLTSCTAGPNETRQRYTEFSVTEIHEWENKSQCTMASSSK